MTTSKCTWTISTGKLTANGIAVKEFSRLEGLRIGNPDFSHLISIAEVAESNSLVP